MHRVLQEHSDLAAGRRHDRLLGVRPLLVGVLLCLVVGVSLLAYATPPDPVWIAGIYDAADYDDVASMVTNTAVAGQFDRPGLAGSIRALLGSVVPVAASVVRSTGASVLRPRSPPLA